MSSCTVNSICCSIQPPQKRSNSDDTIGSLDYFDSLHELQKELELEKPGKKKLRQLMCATFEGRREWIKVSAPCVEEVLVRFSCLKKVKCASSIADSVGVFASRFNYLLHQLHKFKRIAETEYVNSSDNVTATANKPDGEDTCSGEKYSLQMKSTLQQNASELSAISG